MIPLTKDSPLRMVKEMGKKCSRCGNCCSHGSGMLINEDLPRIARFLKTTEDNIKKTYLEEVEFFNTKSWRPRRITGRKPFGPCVFHDKNTGCTIHIVKPLQCLMTNCSPYSEQLIQWLYLNYFVNPTDPESIRQWASYIQHRESVIEGGQLHDLVPDEEKLRKILNYEILK